MSKKNDLNNQLIYSSEQGQLCPKCGLPTDVCLCKTTVSKHRSDGIVRIVREKKKRGGKTVTLISGLPLDNLSLPELAAEIKKTFGCGGSVKDGNILIQGDKRELLFKFLKQKGFVVKIVGI